jgi:hypothetical protein
MTPEFHRPLAVLAVASRIESCFNPLIIWRGTSLPRDNFAVPGLVIRDAAQGENDDRIQQRKDERRIFTVLDVGHHHHRCRADGGLKRSPQSLRGDKGPAQNSKMTQPAQRSAGARRNFGQPTAVAQEKGWPA